MLDDRVEALDAQGPVEHSLDLDAGLIGRSDVGDPLARNHIGDHRRRRRGSSPMRRVVDPDPVRGFLDPGRPRPASRASPPFRARKRRSRRSSTRRTVHGSAQNRPSHDPRWASLRCDRSMSPHSLNTATISSCSSGVSPWTGLPPGAASSRPSPSATRRRHRSRRRWDNSSKRHAARVLHPPAPARTTRSMSAVLVAASTRRGTRPLSPKALFPPPASTAPPSRPTLCADARSRPGPPPARHLAACPAGPDATAKLRERALPGDLAQLRDRRPVHPRPIGCLAHRGLPTHQLHPDLVLLLRCQEPLPLHAMLGTQQDSSMLSREPSHAG